LSVPDELLEAVAGRVAELLAPLLMAPAASPWLDVSEAAEYLRCRPKRVYDLVSQRRIPAHRDGGRLLFRRDELDDYVLGDADTLLTPATNGLQASGFAEPQVLGSIEDACVVDPRLVRIARRSTPHDPPYVPPPARPRGRPGRAPAQNALAEAGQTLSDVAELMPGGASISAVSRWLAGDRPYPRQLPDALEELIGAELAARIIALIPAVPRV
jgi:excisionase family DNA binding protein